MSTSRLSDTARMIADSAERLFAGAAQGEAWDARLWDQLVESGIPGALAATLAEDPGDSDRLGTNGALNLLFVAGQHAAPVPLAEHAVATWLADLAGISLPDGLVVPAGMDLGDTATLDASGRLSAKLVNVPFARNADAALILVDEKLAVARIADARIGQHDAMSGEPRDSLHFDAVAVAATPAAFDTLTLRAALAGVRAVQMAGALDAVLRLTARYVQERVQFGRPISKFQAVQQALAELGGQVATSRAAANLVGDAFGAADSVPLIAAAKIRVGEAVGLASRIAHQAHGAIGYTQEYALQRFTRRLWTWRDDYGSEAWWARWLGLALTDSSAGRGADMLWPIVTQGLRFTPDAEAA